MEGSTAEQVGEMLLDQVEEEGLEEFLRALRKSNELDPPIRINVPAIDRLLKCFMATATTKKSPVVEITATSPGPGNTLLLYSIVGKLVLPQYINQHEIGGLDGAVVVFDLEQCFRIDQLVMTMTRHIEKVFAKSDHIDVSFVNRLVQTSLQHIYIFTPQSIATLISSIEALPSYFLDLDTHSAGNRQLEAIILDGASSFFWQDKMDVEETELGNDEEFFEPHTNTEKRSSYHHLVKAMQEVQDIFDCSVVATSWGIYPFVHSEQRSGRRQLMLKPHLPSVWSTYCTLKLTVEQDAIPRFNEDMTIADALRDAEARQKAVDECRYSARLNMAGSESWSPQLCQALRSHHTSRGFQYLGGPDGVVILP